MPTKPNLCIRIIITKAKLRSFAIIMPHHSSWASHSSRLAQEHVQATLATRATESMVRGEGGLPFESTAASTEKRPSQAESFAGARVCACSPRNLFSATPAQDHVGGRVLARTEQTFHQLQ